MTIEKVYNGYIVSTITGTRVFDDVSKVLAFVLLHFEGLSESFGGEAYGKVVIERGDHAQQSSLPGS